MPEEKMRLVELTVAIKARVPADLHLDELFVDCTDNDVISVESEGPITYEILPIRTEDVVEIRDDTA